MDATLQHDPRASSAHGPEESRLGTAPKLERRPLYFPSGDRRIFGWFHPAATDRTRNCAVVICNPLGHEYTHSHRSLRHLSENLAGCGFATLRFDYDATGDSANDSLAPNRLECWLQDIRAAVTTARSLSGCHNICLLGIRMGAALAAVVASTDDIAHLVLWNPCSGRYYVREMKALSLAAANETKHDFGFESAGFMLLNETADQLKAINLLSLPFRPACDVLLLQRDDMDIDPSLNQHLQQCGANVTQLTMPGYADMMAEPQFTKVPTKAIEQIADWLADRSELLTELPVTAKSSSVTVFTEMHTAHNETDLIERCYQFGRENHLFGIATYPQNNEYRNKPAIVLCNSGSVHRVGPNRLYVTLARQLAAHGFLCFRFDLQGLGDSRPIDDPRENHPYPRSAISDVESALQLLKRELNCSSFILSGLCSGAHAAFHSGISLVNDNIIETILINPLTFHYVEGMSLETTSHHQDVAYYKGSARKLSSWLKLLRGKVDISNLTKLGVAQIKVIVKSLFDYSREKLFDQPTTPLSADLRTLFAHNRSLSLFVAESDPGYSLLADGARYMTMYGIKSKRIEVQFIPAADHTFSSFNPRRDLIDRVCTHILGRCDQRHTAEP